MDAYMRIANCRMLIKMFEDPEYSEKLGLVNTSMINIPVIPVDDRKGESQIDGITNNDLFG